MGKAHRGPSQHQAPREAFLALWVISYRIGFVLGLLIITPQPSRAGQMLFLNSAPKEALPADARGCRGQRSAIIRWQSVLFNDPTSICSTTAWAISTQVPLAGSGGDGDLPLDDGSPSGNVSA